MKDPKVLKLLRFFKIPHLNRNPKENWAWDGKSIALQNTRSNVLHDAAHWLVATEQQRQVPDFGLGSGGESGMTAPVLPNVEDDEQEIKASLLGIIFEFAFGFDWLDTFDAHSWQLSAYEDPRHNHHWKSKKFKWCGYIPEKHIKDIQRFTEEFKEAGFLDPQLLGPIEFESSPVMVEMMKATKSSGHTMMELRKLDKPRLQKAKVKKRELT